MAIKLPKLISKFLPFDTGVQVLILSVVVAIVIAIIYRSFHAKEGFGVMYDTQTRYTDSQRPLFNEKMNKELPYNTGLETDMSRFKDAVNNVDSGINRVTTNNLDMYFEKDPLPGIVAAELVCSNVAEPSQLPARGNSMVGCGWWYQDDDNKTSIGARGTSVGPIDIDIDKKQPGGQWIWDLNLAQKREDAKRCRKVKSCGLADLVPGKCGFCLSTSIGVPLDVYGRPKYAKDERLDCTEPPVTKPGNCPRPAPLAPVVNADGTVTIPPAPRQVCDPIGGRLSVDCLITLALGAGCQEEGAVISILRGDTLGYYKGRTDTNFRFKKAIEMIKLDAKINSSGAYFGDGSCDRDEVLSFYTKIVAAVKSGQTTRSREAAGFLVNGTDFDPCDYDPTQNGPFELYCQQRVAREKGCQPDGSVFPTLNNKSTYDGMTWSKVNDYFAGLRNSMASNDQNEQIDANKKCLGVTIAPVAADCGDTNGCEVFWYTWQYEWDFPEKETSTATFWGREIKPTLPDFNTGGNEFNPYGAYDRMAMRVRTRLTNKTTSQGRIWVMTDDGVAVKADNKMVLRSWWDQGPTAYQTNPFQLIENKATPLDMYFYENYGGATFVPRLQIDNGAYQPVPAQMLTMRVPSGFPIARWDFYMGSLKDRNNVLGSNAYGSIPFGVVDGKKCALFTDQNYIQITNPICVSAFKSITMMIYIRSNPPNHGEWPRLWEMNNYGFNGSWCQDSLFGCMSPNNSMGLGFYSKQWCWAGPDMWTGGGTSNPGRWIHVAWVLDQDYGGMTTYIDGVSMSRRTDFWLSYNLQQGSKTFNTFYIFNSSERFNKDVAVAWFHMFDYVMDKDDIQMDRGLGFIDSTVYPEDVGTGWKSSFKTK